MWLCQVALQEVVHDRTDGSRDRELCSRMVRTNGLEHE